MLRALYAVCIYPKNTTSTPSVQLIQLIRRVRLSPRSLPSHRHSHGMPPPPITAHLPQRHDICSQLPPQLVLDLHARQRAGDFDDFFVVEGVEAGGWMDVHSGHHLGGDLVADTVEAF